MHLFEEHVQYKWHTCFIMEFYYLQIIFILMKRAKLLGAKSLGGLLAKTFLGSPETLFLRFHCAVYRGTMAKSQALQSRLFLLKQTPNSPVQNWSSHLVCPLALDTRDYYSACKSPGYGQRPSSYHQMLVRLFQKSSEADACFLFRFGVHGESPAWI